MFVEKLIETERLAKRLLEEYGLAEQGWTFEWDSSKHRIGQCRYSEKEIGYSTYYLEKTSTEEIEDTIRHEIAHALVGSGHGHDNVWKRKAIEVGANPKSCGGPEAISSATPNYIIECSACGRRWKRYRLRKRAYVNAISRCCQAPFKFYRVRKGK